MRGRVWLFFLTMTFTPMGAMAGEVIYYHNDLSGSPVAATNQAGQVIWRESYRPYGERLTNSAAASGNKIWFTSRRQDVETGLVYMGARYYDPVTGRFISTDPKLTDEGNIHSFNRYAYANNNPYRFFDPDGREPGNLYQRGYVPPPAQIFPEPGLVRFIPEIVLIPGGIAKLVSKVAAPDEAPLPANSSSKYQDITTGNSVPNRATDVTRAEFERNLTDGGWMRTTSKDGKVSIFEKDGASYRIRDTSKEGSKTAEYFREGSERAELKIRLAD